MAADAGSVHAGKSLLCFSAERAECALLPATEGNFFWASLEEKRVMEVQSKVIQSAPRRSRKVARSFQRAGLPAKHGLPRCALSKGPRLPRSGAWGAAEG